MGKRQCVGQTAKGNRCKNMVKTPEVICPTHVSKYDAEQVRELIHTQLSAGLSSWHRIARSVLWHFAMNSPHPDSKWTHQICVSDWNKKHPDREDVKSEDYNQGDTELCCYCGELNDSGIYIREDPLVVHP